MPNDNKQQPVTAPPIIFTEDALPPMPQENSGSAAPADDIVMPVITTSTTPKKKFAGGKVIATILGLFLLIGGVGAGVMLVGQNQDIRERASCMSRCTAEPDECEAICDMQDGADSVEDYDGTRDNSSRYQTGDRNQDVEDVDDGDGGNVTPPVAPFDPLFGCSSTTNALMGYCPPPSGGGNGCISAGCGNDSSLICHCQNGQSCGWGVCVSSSSFTTACTGDGRQPSHNSGNSSAWTCCENGYVAGPNQQGCVLSGDGGLGGGTPSEKTPSEETVTTTTATDITAQCQNIKAYSPTWALLTNAQLSVLTTGSQVNFCVAGSASDGSFDKARLTINGVLQAETSTIRPGSTDFCQLYVIPAGTTTFNVTAQIHHLTLGWK